MAELCLPCFSRIIITTPGTFKKSKPEEIYAVFNQELEKVKQGPATETRPSSVELFFIPDTAQAVHRAIALAKEHELPVLGTGSFYLAAEIRKQYLLN